MKAVEFFVGHHHAIAQAGLLTEDDGFGVHADRVVDFGVLDEAFAQTGVGALVAGGVEGGVFGVVLLREAVLHGCAGVSLGLLCLFGKVILWKWRSKWLWGGVPANGLSQRVNSSLILALQSCKAPRGAYPDFTSCEIWGTAATS